MTKIVVLDGYALNPGDLDWAILAEKGNKKWAQLTVFDRTPPALLLQRAKEADVIVINKINVTAELLDKLPKLRLIAITATGTNNIDLAAAKNKGIPVKNVIGYSSNAVAQHVFALILGLTNQVEKHNQSVTQQDWTNNPDFSYFLAPWQELAGKTLGIYGLGNIGHQVAFIAQGFGMKVIAFNRSNDNRNKPITMVSSDELLEQSDILSLHAPLSDATKYFINDTTLRKMKPEALIINTARGPLIAEMDLAKALKSKIIAGAGLDVLCDEPPQADNPLIGISNCLVTPHIAWTSTEARQALLQKTAENISSVLL